MRSKEDLQECLHQLKVKLAELVSDDALDTILQQAELRTEIASVDSQLTNYVPEENSRPPLDNDHSF